MERFNYIIVIGASAGGINAAIELLSKLNKNINAAVFITFHLSKKSNAKILARALQKHTQLKCIEATDKLKIQKGCVYLAPADSHLFIKKGTMLLTKGPTENRWRPSIDVLFRSEAVAYGTKTVGIILSGLMNDGTSGMHAIKKSGGTCIVQDPNEAEFNDMPSSVLDHVKVDYTASVNDMAYVLEDVVSKKPKKQIVIPPEIMTETAITEKMAGEINDLKKIGSHTNYICPDCGGGLWHIKKDAINRYRCHTGHVYNETVLLEKQSEALEESLWTVLRIMEERRNLLNEAAKHNEKKDKTLFEQYTKDAKDIKGYIERLKPMLAKVSDR
ncbi:MAG: hypothetical protein JWO32_2366 [Bacteroidetes bacterium]|nr:hypothetical protein [Bacteroidota bacterium]